MTIDEAIENLREEAEFERGEKNLLMVDSIKLGIEALKLLGKRRRFAVPDRVDLLPGETLKKE